jgi:hypothetical protein
MKFSAFLAFITIWLLVVYCPIAHMVWSSEGWIYKDGAIDFAGGLVVHMSSGFSALVAAIVLGKRRGFGRDPMPPHSLPLCLIGAGLLWAGWFGFNAGSALSASGLAALAFVNTGTAASAAVLTWAAIEWGHRGKPTALGGATAAVAGLVAITPACGNVSPLGAIAIGIGVAAICYAAVTFVKPALGYDDSLYAFGVHLRAAHDVRDPLGPQDRLRIAACRRRGRGRRARPLAAQRERLRLRRIGRRLRALGPRARRVAARGPTGGGGDLKPDPAVSPGWAGPSADVIA